MLVNTAEFQRTAQHFIKHGVYTEALPGTKPYFDFWDEQKQRCLHGYSVGGKKITGFHYHYLNFTQIPTIHKITLPNGRKVDERRTSFPSFYDGDYDYFWVCDIARYGIDKADYEALGLGVEVKTLDGGRHVIVLKARRKGYSYKAASMLVRNFFHGKSTHNYTFASMEEYLTKDGLLNKAWDIMNFVNQNTAYTQPLLDDRMMHKRCGYKEKHGGTYVDKGLLNEIIGVSLKGDPDKARGKAGDLMFWEEMGKFPELKDAWDISKPMVKEGISTIGLMVAFGTGGTEGANFESAEQLFYDPENNDCIVINNQWDDGAYGTECGFFVPIYKNLPGFMDKDGNSIEDEAIAYEKTEREKKRKARDKKTLARYTAEHPFNPREATLAVDANLFPTHDLVVQKNQVMAHKRYNFGINGWIVNHEDGLKFQIDGKAKPIMQYPHSKEDDLTGCIVMYEAPIRSAGNQVPSELYVVCHDPYAHDTSTDMSSLGAAYVIKRTNNLSGTYHDCIVASYVARPQTQDEYNRNLFLLAEYYNAKIGFENDRGDVIGYAKRFKKLHYLEEQFSFLDKVELQGKSRRPYGMNMTTNRSEQAEIYIRDWLNRAITNFDDGSKMLILNTILDPALLEELIKYNSKGNFDRVKAIMIGMYHLKEKHNKEVKAVREHKAEEFFDKEIFI